MKKVLFYAAICLHICFTQTQPPPLYNFGATCFMNASLQFMFNMSGFETLNPDNYTTDSLANLYAQLTQNKSTTLNINLLQQFTNKAYADMHVDCGSQQDATEFLSILINKLTEPTQSKQLTDQITTTIQSTIECPSGYKSSTKGILYILSIAITGTHLTDCLKDINQKENIIYKPNNIDEECTKQPIISKLPDTLILSLNRFNAYNQKIITPVIIPEQINMKEYCIPTISSQEFNYELISIIRQGGSTTGGHYVAYVKTFDGQWYSCNDNIIEKITFQANQNNINQGYVYCYQRKGTRSKPTKPLPPLPLNAHLTKLTESLNNLTHSLRAR